MGEWKDKVMWRYPTPSDKTEREQQLELESEQTKIEKSWQQVRIQAAVAAMQGMLANPAYQKAQVESGEPFAYFYAMNAIMCADALIAELQKKDDNADIQQ